MLRQLTMLVALLASSGLISIGHGAVAGLLVQQGGQNNFSEPFIGLLVSVSYCGFFVGNYLFRYLLPRISYIRTFSVCAAVLAVCTLLLPTLPTAVVWLVLRFVHGLFFSTSVVICEGWLSSIASTENRSRLHAVYMTVNYIAYGASQYILIIGERQPSIAFSVAAIFITLSLLPICLTRFAEPQFASPTGENKALSIKAAYWISPIAFMGQFMVGAITSAGWLFVAYASDVTTTTTAASQLSVLFFASGLALHFPIGWLSDRISDRRYLMVAIYILSSLFSLVLLFGDSLPFGILAVVICLFGSFSATLFSLNVVYGQGFAGREAVAEYNGRLFQSYSAGALIGPLAAGVLMNYLSATWLFGFISAVCAVSAILTLTDRLIPSYKPVRPKPFQPLSPHATLTSEEMPLYNEYDVGPTLPAEEMVVSSDDLLGPTVPEGGIEPVEQSVSTQLVGPALPADDQDR